MNFTVIKKIRYNLKILRIAFVCFFGISLFFIFSSVPQKFIGKFLSVDPSYTGGFVCVDFIDDFGDDKGAGGAQEICYPLNKKFEKGSLDLLRYTVHQLVINARWQQSAEYWQLSLEYKSGPSIVRNIMIYIDADNIAGGSTDPLFDLAENVSFDENHPWNFAVWICGGEGKLYDSTGAFICNTEYYCLNNETKINIRIPLCDKRVQKILGAKKTYHYVLTGAYSQFDRGGFMRVEKKTALSHGGMKDSKNYNSLVPPVYDITGENKSLGSWNPDTFEKAVLVPIEVKMTALKNSKDEKEKNEAYVKYVKKLYEENFNSQNQQNKTTDENLAFYKEKISADPEDFVSLAYYGSYLAVKGGESFVIKAVALVNEAYTYLDKAAKMAEGKDGEIEVLMNRASVSASVPDAVFGKACSGAEDFMKVVSLTENKILKAYCYVMAYECYMKCGKETQSILALHEAKKMVQLD